MKVTVKTLGNRISIYGEWVTAWGSGLRAQDLWFNV
jgi:hypothetical protein